MARKTHYVVPNSDRGGWEVKRGGASKASKHFDGKKDAEQYGREVSKNQRTEFVIHGRRSDSHGNDPYPPKGYRKCVFAGEVSNLANFYLTNITII